MDPPDLELPDAFAAGPDPSEETTSSAEATRPDAAGMAWLGEIVAQLERDPDECWPAIEALAAVDSEVRVQIIAALAEHRERPGVRSLLDLLGSVRDPAARTAARHAVADDWTTTLAVAPSGRDGADLAVVPGAAAGRIVRSLVTAVDGEGSGTVVVSVRDGAHRRTAAFRCDVRRGILDVVGEVEREHPMAGGLVDEWIEQAQGDCVVDVPELAVRLLRGSLMLRGNVAPDRVRAWIDATIGEGMLVSGSAVTLPGPEPDAIADEELPARVDRVLDACPGWLDRSALTYELAAEITLREGRRAPDPRRDAGAYRYLFEHLLIGRLELFARMLLWMAWVWHAAGRAELARSAFVLAGQLSDEQYAVPSHPFTVALSTRSLQAAQGALLTGKAPGTDA